MENNNSNQQHHRKANMSNIIFGTSSDIIEEGLHTGQFLETNGDKEIPGIDDKNQIVNEQEQNEIVNPSEESFNEGISPASTIKENITTSEKKELPKEEK
ncbi:MAG: hypothetical protein ABIN89_08840 [Chitinophagaceae bacterium]